MLDLNAIEAQLAKGDPKLKSVYLKLKAKAEGGHAGRLAQDLIGKVVAAGLDPGTMRNTTVKVEEAEGGVVVTAATEATVPKVEAQFICSKCSKVCGSKAGLGAHERKCKA